mgnify:FL=1
MQKGIRKQRKGEGGVRKLYNGKIEGTYTLHRENGTTLKKSFTRKNYEEILDIKASLRNLGILANNVKDVKINKYTNEVTIERIGQSKNSSELNKDISFFEYCCYYLENYRKNGLKGRKVEATTFASYVDKIKLLNKYMGDIKLRLITLNDLEDCIEKINKNTCDTTARQARDMLESIMYYAHKDGVIEENILQDKKITLKESKGKKEKKVIKKKDLKAFFDCCMKHKYYILVMGLNTGLRASELAGITWDNINWEEKTVTVEKEYMRVYEYNSMLDVRESKKVFKDLKTKNSYRTIGLNEEMMKILKLHKQQQMKLAERQGKIFSEKDWVFTTKKYEGYLSDYIGDSLKKVVTEIKAEGYKELTTHCLRHTYCTLGIERGIRVEEMKYILGHSNIAVTSNWYTHLDKKKIVNDSNTVNTYLENFMK